MGHKISDSMTKQNDTNKNKTNQVTYNRHISFDDLLPDFLDEEIQLIKDSDRHIGFNNKYVHVPPQYNPLYAQKKNVNSLDEKSQELSILKMDPRDLAEQQNIEDIDIGDMDKNTERIVDQTTRQNTQLNSGSKDAYTQSLFSNLNEVEDRVSKQKNLLNFNDNNNNMGIVSENDKPRRKSFAGMTNEELAQLETFYTSRGRSTESNMSNYDFTQRESIFSLKPDLYSNNNNNDNNNNDNNFANNNNSNSKWQQEAKLEQVNKEIAETLAVTYPSRPVVDHRAISLTIENNQFKSYVSNIRKNLPLKEEENGEEEEGRDLSSSLRVINCFISGKRYTWSSVDWYVENLAKDGDHLVIVTSVPNFETKIDNILYTERRLRTKKETVRAIMSGRISSSPSSSLSTTTTTMESNPKTEAADNSKTIHKSNKDRDLPLTKAVRLEAVYKEAKDAANSILEYYAGRLQNKIVKITVELVKTDSIKDAITKTAVLYKPFAQIVSTVSTNIQIKFRNGKIKLPYFMMKYYPMPVFIVPFEFIHPKKLTEECKTIVKKVNRKNRLEWLDNTIKYTLRNPYSIEKELLNPNEFEDMKHVPDSDCGSDDESVTSINNYFPVDPQVQKKSAIFEELGYVMPKPSRDILLEENDDVVYDKDGKRLTPCTSRSSRRSSRVQLGGSANNIYKVKSLITDDIKSNYTVDSNLTSNKTTTPSIRKIKSMGYNSKNSKIHSNHNHHHHLFVNHKSNVESSSPSLNSSSNKNHTSKDFQSNITKKAVPIESTSNSGKDKSKTKKKSGFKSIIGKLFK